MMVVTWSEFERDREMAKREKIRRLGVGVSGFWFLFTEGEEKDMRR